MNETIESIGSDVRIRGKRGRRKRVPLFACMECGKRFYSVGAAERGSFGDDGCPGCGGSDIDIYAGKGGAS